MAYRLNAPALKLPDPARVVCHEDEPERLLAELAIHRLDAVISDAPLGSATKIRAYSHLLGECGVSVSGPGSWRAATSGDSRARRRAVPAALAGDSVEETRARCSVISGERTLKHPAVVAILDAARSVLFREEA